MGCHVIGVYMKLPILIFPLLKNSETRFLFLVERRGRHVIKNLTPLNSSFSFVSPTNRFQEFSRTLKFLILRHIEIKFQFLSSFPFLSGKICVQWGSYWCSSQRYSPDISLGRRWVLRRNSSPTTHLSNWMRNKDSVSKR